VPFLSAAPPRGRPSVAAPGMGSASGAAHAARVAPVSAPVPAGGDLPALVLFDRDGTLVADVPYNRDPALVRPLPGVRKGLDRLRHAGVAVGVVTNQSGVGTGRIRPDELAAVNARVDALLGPFDVWQVCPHAPTAGCQCRKPAPGLVLDACAALGVTPARCLVIGDIGSDMQAAAAAGAHAIIVPTPATRAEEVAAAPATAPDLPSAVAMTLDGRW